MIPGIRGIGGRGKVIGMRAGCGASSFFLSGMVMRCVGRVFRMAVGGVLD